MRDLLKLIGWTVVDLFRSRAALEAEIWTLRQQKARCLAARLVGKGAPYRSLPWFWSDQGSDKLQIVGLTHDVDRTVLRGSPETGSFSVFCYAVDRLLGIESVNRAADHVVGRKILERGGSVDPKSAADSDFVLKTLLE